METDDKFLNSEDFTQLDGINEENYEEYEGISDVEPVAVEKDGMWKKVSIAGGIGILLGAVGAEVANSAFAKTSASADNIAPEQETSPEQEANGNPLVDDGISLATTVNNDMTFAEAFAAAREEVGTGGAFEWNGNLYSTYTAEEWDNMSHGEKTNYYSHFAWYSENDTSTQHVAHTTHHADNSNNVAQDSAQPNEDVHAAAMTQPENESADEQDDVAVIEEHEPDVEVLGVYHNSETGMNVGGLVIDNQEIVVLDVDGDHTFDIAASDLNHDGDLQRNEIVDISKSNLTVEDLLENMNPDNDIYTGNDTVDDIDYSVEA